MSATVISLKATGHKTCPQKSKIISLEVKDFENIQLEIRAARSMLAVAMKSAIDGGFRANTIGEAFFGVLGIMENVCNKIDKAKGEA